VLDRVDGDRELLSELAELFLQDCANQLSAVKDAVTTGDPETLERAAHRLKGSVGDLGAKPAVEAVLTLETMGSDGDLTNAAQAYADLEARIEELMHALTEFVTVEKT